MFDADIAFVNGGGVRANIPTGDITFQQIINVHPFGNTAVLAEVTGQQILDALEMGARVCPSENGGFLQVAGLTYEIHTYLDPNCVVGSDKMWQGTAGLDEYRVKNVKVLNKTTGEYEPLDLEKKYTLASHNYMLKDMGDGFAMFGSNITILEDSGKLDNQVLIDYIQSMPEEDGKHVVEGYTDPKGEGRIKIVTERPTPVFYGEDVEANDVAEYTEDGKTIYRYDVKVKDVNPRLEVVGLQAYLQFDNTALKFVEAKSVLEGSTGINEDNGLISFAWASNGDGVKLDDETVVVSIYFELMKPVADGTKIDIVFAEGANGAKTGFSYVSDGTVVEADPVNTEDGSITFSAPETFSFVGEDVLAADVTVIEDGKKLYRYDIKVADAPEGGLMINSAQIFLAFDANLLTFAKAEGLIDWTVGEKTGKIMAVWADDEEITIRNGDVVLSIYFEASADANGKTVDIAFTTNALNTVSAASVLYGGSVYELEAETVDGSITFPVIVWGDANCDGKVTAADAAMILRSVVGLAELSAQGALNADVNCDLKVDAEDAALVLRYVVKLIAALPVED
jgi:hypothetical protein